MDPPANITENDMRVHLRDRVQADLAHILEENGVPLPLQYNLTQAFTTVRKLGALADSRAAVREALAADLQLRTDTLAKRAAVAAVVSSWESAKEYSAKEAELKAEARLLGVSKPVTQTDRGAMRTAYIAAHGPLEDQHEPSESYLSEKLEELEAHEPTASPLSDVTSRKAQRNSGIQTTLDSNGQLRIIKQKQKGSLPSNTEELRTVLRIEGTLWCFLAAKYRNKHFLDGMTPTA